MAAGRADDLRRPETPKRRRGPEAREGTELRADRPEVRYPDREPGLTAAEGARLAAAYVAEMTGREPEEITLLEATHDGGWRVGVEVVEAHRIPDSADILAVYQIELDMEGELLSYRRTRRRLRSQVRGD
jgi:hypothetical protein